MWNGRTNAPARHRAYDFQESAFPLAFVYARAKGCVLILEQEVDGRFDAWQAIADSAGRFRFPRGRSTGLKRLALAAGYTTAQLNPDGTLVATGFPPVAGSLRLPHRPLSLKQYVDLANVVCSREANALHPSGLDATRAGTVAALRQVAAVSVAEEQQLSQLQPPRAIQTEVRDALRLMRSARLTYLAEARRIAATGDPHAVYGSSDYALLKLNPDSSSQATVLWAEAGVSCSAAL
jgi:hypothetical protein